MIGILLDVITSVTSRDLRAQLLGFALFAWTGLFILTVATDFGKNYIQSTIEETFSMRLGETDVFFTWFFVMIAFVILIRWRFTQLRNQGIEP